MPTKPRIPSYRLHKASGQAVVVLNGMSVYLGKWNTPMSRVEYERVIAEWLANSRRLPRDRECSSCSPTPADPNDLRVSELILAFFEHAKKHYRHPDGTPTGELDNHRDALRPLRRVFGHTLAMEFGPLRLRAVREEMVRAGLCRTTINARVHRIRRAFRWAASMELIPASVVEALNTVASLQRGRCDARESNGVQPVNWNLVDRILPHLPRAVAAMVEIMRYSNCRAEDVVMMRPCDLSMESAVWEYRPASHKNQWREETSSIHKRIVHLGPRCQLTLRPFLGRPADAYLFSPQEARAEYQTQRAARRKTKRTPSEFKRERKANPQRVPKCHYSVNTFQQTVRRTCQKLGLPVWTVLQVRHSRATEVRERYGLEGAAASLGDTVEAAQIYAEKNRLLAQKIAREFG
jgi:integrase